MSASWILAADAASARLFETPGPGGQLRELEDWQHAEARQHISEMVSDQPGEVFDRAGHGRHDMEPGEDPKTHEARRFARQLAQKLNQGRLDGAYRKLVLAAPARFLGLLREQLDADTAALVAASVSKDLVKLDPAEIRRSLPEWW